ncbi:hypothetical protein ILYODFUR_028156 [Ilyodon furcidens]|uniref:Uncharacterized protein n=1 Tax=Ilyodon furcidens TaxID=33524 RepID=A0ABV0V9C2_9TELE
MLRHQASQREQKETTAACRTHPGELLHSGSTNSPPAKPQSFQPEDPVTLLLLSGFLSCFNRCIIQIKLLKRCPGLVVVLISEWKKKRSIMTDTFCSLSYKFP